MNVVIKKNIPINWEDLSKMYLNSEMGEKSPEKLRMVFENSQHCYYAFDGDRLIGAARAFSDGNDCVVVCDVGVLTELQGKGVGKLLMNEMMKDIAKYERKMLFATVGKEGFYEKFGFGMMTTGMCIFKDQNVAIENGYIKQ